jgi:predicted metalloprotease with PDZ domain
MFQSTNLRIEQGFIPLISHEYFHTWIGGDQGLKMPAPDEIYKWFSEGFTDYYSFKLVKLMGTISNEDFLSYINQYLREY